MILTILLCIIAGLLFVLYKRWLVFRNRFKEMGVPYVQPYPLIGNIIENLKAEKSFAEIARDLCYEFKNEPLIGFYNFMKPAFIVNDLDYAETVLITEFSSFMNRAEDFDLEDRRPLDKHLLFIGGSEWKAVRSKLTPVFTTGKLRGMLPEVESIFDKTFDGIDSAGTIDLKEAIEKFTIRVRASCVFGLDLSKSVEEDRFIKTVKNMSEMSLFGFVRVFVALWLPKLAKTFDFSAFGSDNERYLMQILLVSFEERVRSNTVRNDFVQLLLELKNTGKVEVKQWTQDDDYLKSSKYSTTETVEITDDILAAQSFVFLVAGLETLISTLTMLFVELSLNPRASDKLREEVDRVIASNKEFSYQALKEMEYLELCIKETLRMHSPVEFTVRHCCRNYTFPNGVTIDKGTDVIIPIIKYQMDPKVFPNPHEFRPERFEEDTFHKCAYIPFGQGPRICIGMRFAMLEMKMLASKLIYNYSFKLDPKTELPVKTDKWYFLRKHVTPVYISFDSRNH